MATLPGIPLYERYGFAVDGRMELTLPDGVRLEGAEMSKSIAPA